MVDPLLLAESTVLRTLLSLPAPAQRALAGKPVVIDGNRLDRELQLILRLQKLVGAGLDQPTLEEARRRIVHECRLIGGRQPIGRTESVEVDGAEGRLPARLYVPRADSDALLVYFHGGGWTVGSLGSADPLCRFLAERAGVRVLSVEYRLAPEHPYPAPNEDALAAVQWAFAHASELGVDPKRIAVGGDSAGGALAATTAVRAAEAGLPLRAQLLIYPATRIGQAGPSRKLFGQGFILTDESMDTYEDHYLQGGHVGDPGHSVGYRTDFPTGFAPTIIAIGGFDSLRDEEVDYAALLREQSQQVVERFYPGLTHGFANFLGYNRGCRAAVAELAADLKAALA